MLSDVGLFSCDHGLPLLEELEKDVGEEADDKEDGGQKDGRRSVPGAQVGGVPGELNGGSLENVAELLKGLSKQQAIQLVALILAKG